MIVDIHSHILPGLDDGAKGMEEAILMASQAAERGVTHVVATPHHRNGTFMNEPPQILDAAAELNSVLRRKGISLKIIPGMELHMHGEILKDMQDMTNKIMPLARNKYILIELPYTYIPHFTESVFYRLQLMGFIPVIAHPERNTEFKRHPNRLFDFISHGALAQLTAGSVTGRFGRKSQKFSLKLLKHRLVHFIASDAHNTTDRACELVPAYTYIEKHFSKEYSRYLIDNSVHAVHGEEFRIIPPQRFEKKKQLLMV